MSTGNGGRRALRPLVVPASATGGPRVSRHPIGSSRPQPGPARSPEVATIGFTALSPKNDGAQVGYEPPAQVAKCCLRATRSLHTNCSQVSHQLYEDF